MSDHIIVATSDSVLGRELEMALQSRDFHITVVASARALFDCEEGGIVLIDLRITDPAPLITCTTSMKRIALVCDVAELTPFERTTFDDFVVLPLRGDELIARIDRVRAVGKKSSVNRPVRSGDLVLDAANNEVWMDGKATKLTSMEFALLVHLTSHPGEVFSRENLLRLVWGYRRVSNSNTVNTHINRLRRKLSLVAGTTSVVETVRGGGYRSVVSRYKVA